jgi:hypothetical protein
MKPLYITHWWGDAYKEKAKRWVWHCRSVGIDYMCVERKQNEYINYQEAINNKVDFIIHMLQKYKRPVVYLDVDVCVRKPPVLFDKLTHYDIMCFNWNADIRVTKIVDPYVFETPGCVMGFGYSTQVFNLLSMWRSFMGKRKFKRVADDRMFAMIVHDQNLVCSFRCMWLPLNYCCYKEFFNCANVVIDHPDNVTTEDEARLRGSFKNRIPKGYSNYRSIANRGLGDMSGERVNQHNVNASGIVDVKSFAEATLVWNSKQHKHHTVCCNMRYKKHYDMYDIVVCRNKKNKHKIIDDTRFILRPCGAANALIASGSLLAFNTNPGFYLSMRVLFI